MFLYHLKKEFFNLVNFLTFERKNFSIRPKSKNFPPKISPKIFFSKIPENHFSIWTCGALSPSFKVLGRKPCPGAMEQTRK